MMRPPSAPWAPIAALIAGIAIILGVTVLFRTPATQEPPTTGTPSKMGACKIGGCSAQLCGEADKGDLVSTCEFRAEYACYKSATCERQSNGECGWTQTASLTACLANPPILE